MIRIKDKERTELKQAIASSRLFGVKSLDCYEIVNCEGERPMRLLFYLSPNIKPTRDIGVRSSQNELLEFNLMNAGAPR